MIYYIDVDDTLVRTVGSKVIPIIGTIDYIKQYKKRNDCIYLWSRGGAQYCRDIAEKLNISSWIDGYLPKPDVIIDDCEMSKWEFLKVIHPCNIRAAQQVDSAEASTIAVPPSGPSGSPR